MIAANLNISFMFLVQEKERVDALGTIIVFFGRCNLKTLVK